MWRQRQSSNYIVFDDLIVSLVSELWEEAWYRHPLTLHCKLPHIHWLQTALTRRQVKVKRDFIQWQHSQQPRARIENRTPIFSHTSYISVFSCSSVSLSLLHVTLFIVKGFIAQYVMPQTKAGRSSLILAMLLCSRSHGNCHIWVRCVTWQQLWHVTTTVKCTVIMKYHYDSAAILWTHLLKCCWRWWFSFIQLLPNLCIVSFATLAPRSLRLVTSVLSL